jgi:LuxR family transcriptional regulator, maltose regulon positive regulatory protein
LLARGELVSLMRWLRVLPEAILRTRPRLLLLLSWVLPNTGAIADSARYLAEAEALMADNPDPLLRSEFLATRIPLLIYQDKTAEVIASSRQVLEHLPVEHFFHSLTALIMGLALFRESRLSEAVQALSYAAGVARGKQQLFLLVPSLCFLAQIAADRGDFIQADQLYEQALAECRAANGTLSPIAGMALVELGRLRWWQGRSEEAAHALEHGMELCIQLNAAGHFFLDGYTALAEIKLAQGHPVEAIQQLALAEERVRDFFNPVFMATISAYRANIWHAQGDQAAKTWLHAHYASLEQPLLLPREKENVTLVRLMIDAQQYDQALAAIERLVAFAHTVGCTRSEVDLLVLRAIVRLSQSDKSAAQAALDQSLALAAPMGYARVFLDESRALASLLAQIARGDSPAARYATKLITSFPEGRLQIVDVRLKEEKPTTYHLQFAMLEPLSEREREILRQIAAGRSNQEIAATLVIAISTVKKHINNIFGKLDVQSRTQALVRARELDLL